MHLNVVSLNGQVTRLHNPHITRNAKIVCEFQHILFILYGFLRPFLRIYSYIVRARNGLDRSCYYYSKSKELESESWKNANVICGIWTGRSQDWYGCSWEQIRYQHIIAGLARPSTIIWIIQSGFFLRVSNYDHLNLLLNWSTFISSNE